MSGLHMIASIKAGLAESKRQDARVGEKPVRGIELQNRFSKEKRTPDWDNVPYSPASELRFWPECAYARSCSSLALTSKRVDYLVRRACTNYTACIL